MDVLITGASGFVGAHLARALLARGDRVTCLLREGRDASALDGLAVERVPGDVTEPASLPRAVEGKDVVFHLAGIRRSPERQAFFHVNAEGTRHVLDAMVGAGGKGRLVLAGSLAAVGPSSPDRPHTEDAPLHPHEWYGESKAEAERITLSYADRLPVTVARPPRILGPGDRENLAFFKLAAHGLKLELKGGPRPLSMVDVADVVDGLLLMAERPEALGQAFFLTAPETATLEGIQDLAAELLGKRPRTLRLSPRQLTALATLADGASRLTGRHLPLNRKLARQLLAPAWTCSPEKAERLLGFRARHALQGSVRESARWYLAHGWV